MSKKRNTKKAMSAAELALIVGTVILTGGLLFIGVRSATAQPEPKPEQSQAQTVIPKAPIEVVKTKESCDPDSPDCDPIIPGADAPLVPLVEKTEELCGSKDIQETVASLRKSCEDQRICFLGNGYSGKNSVDVSKVYEASEHLQFTMGWFGSGRSRVAGRADRGAKQRIRAFLKKVLSDDNRKVTLFVFGSSSPTGRAKVNLRLGQQRTEAFAQAVFDEAAKLGKEHLITLGKTNLGHENLDANFCSLLPEGSSERTTCDRKNSNAARQAAYVLAYADLCMAEETSAPKASLDADLEELINRSK